MFAFLLLARGISLAVSAATAASDGAGLECVLGGSLVQHAKSSIMSNQAQPQAESESQAIERTLKVIDSNEDGKIEPGEVAKFAEAHGVDATAVTKQFSGLDSDGDGTLDANEIAKALEQDHKPEKLPTSTGATKQSDKSEDKHKASSPPAHSPNKENQVENTWNVHAGPAAHIASTPSSSSSTLKGALFPGKIPGDQGSAQSTAKIVAEQLHLEANKEREADILDGDVAVLRANISALTKVVVEYGNEAGEKAAEKRGEEIVREVADLTSGAEKAEIEAATLRSKLRTSLQTANDYMVASQNALDDSSNRSAI